MNVLCYCKTSQWIAVRHTLKLQINRCTPRGRWLICYGVLTCLCVSRVDVSECREMFMPSVLLAGKTLLVWWKDVRVRRVLL